MGQGLAFVRPFLEFYEALRFSASRLEPAKLGELANRALRVEGPECRLQDLHRQRTEAARRSLGMEPHVVERASRTFGVAAKMPWSGEGDDPLDLDQVRGG